MDDMLKKRRSKYQREIDIAKIAPLYLKGLNYREISQQLGLSIKQVSSDICSIKEDWRKAYIEDFNELRKRELLKIDLIEAEAWSAWEKSKQGRTSRVKSAEDSQQFGSRRSATEEHAESHGDIQYLQTVQWCVTNRARLLGIYGIAKVENPEADANNDANKFSRDEVLSLIDSIAGRVAVVASQTPANLLEAMRNAQSSNSGDIIDAEVSEVLEPKQLNPASEYTNIINDIESKVQSNAEIHNNTNHKENIEVLENTTDSLLESTEEDGTVPTNRQQLLELLRSRKSEKTPDPKYDIPRTRKDDLRVVLRDLDATRISSDIYDERISEINSVSPTTSKTGQSINGKYKITK